MNRLTLVACMLVLVSGVCANTADPIPTPPPPQSSVWEVCDWGEEKACDNCTLGFSWGQQGVLFYRMVDAAGEVSLGSVPARCSVVER